VNDLRSRVNIKERVPAGKTPGRADGVLRHFSADFSEKSGIVGLTPPFCGRPRLILAVGTQAMRISHFCSIKPGVAAIMRPAKNGIGGIARVVGTFAIMRSFF
jgi:hypothetical protein